MNREYTRIAHRRAVFMELQRVLMDTYISSSSTPKKEIICDEASYSEKEVSQDALIEVFEQLERMQQDERVEMSKFELRRRDDRPADQQPPKPPKARKEKEPPPPVAVVKRKKRREESTRAPEPDGDSANEAG